MRKLGDAFVEVKPKIDKSGFARTVEDALGSTFGALGVTLAKRLTDGLLSTKGVVLAASAGTTLAVGVMFDASIKAASEFEAKMVKLTTTAGETGTMTSGNLQKVSQGILQMAGDTATSAQKLADGVYKIEGAGFHGAEGLKLLRAAAEGARAEQSNLSTVTNALTSIMTSYAGKLKDPVAVTNMMIAAVGHGKVTFEEFSGSLSTVLPTAAAAQISFEQIAAAIATMTNHGSSAAQATVDLQFAIRALQGPNMQAQKEMQRLGLDSLDLSSRLGERGLTGTLQMVTEAITNKMGPAGAVLLNTFNTSKQATNDVQIMLDSMPASMQRTAKAFRDGAIGAKEWRDAIKAMPVDQANLARQFGTTVDRARGFNDFLKSGTADAQTYVGALTKTMGGDAGMRTALMLTGPYMDQFKGNVGAVAAAGQQSGEHIEGWDKIQQTSAFQMDAFKARLESMKISLGLGLLPLVTQFMKSVNDLLTPLMSWMNTHQQLSGIILGSVGGLALIVGSVIAFSKALKMAEQAMVLLRIATIAEDGALVANPIGIVVIAIVALVAIVIYAWTHFKGFREVVIACWDGIKTAAIWTWNNALKPAFEAIVVAAKAVGGAAVWLWENALKPAFNGIAEVATWLWRNVIFPYFKAWELLFTNVIGPVVMWLLHNVVRPVFEGIRVVVEIAWKIIKFLFDAWWAYITNVLAPVLQWLWTHIVKPVFEGIWRDIEAKWHLIKVIFEALGGFIKEHVAPKFEEGMNHIKTIWAALKNYASEPVAFVIDWVINKGIIDPFNEIAKLFGVKDRVGHIANPFNTGAGASGNFAGGGHVQGRGTETSDSIPAWLSRNEYVIPASVVHAYGVDYFDQLIGKRKGYAGGGLVDAVMDPAKWVAGKVDGFIDRIPGGGMMRNVLGGMARKGAGMLTDWIGHFFSKPGAGGGATAGGDLGQWIATAMALTGVPAYWAPMLNTLIMRESGGNPNSINLVDINAQNGDPSRGLMQTIGATFNAYRLPGLSDNIFDPVSNIVAGIRYIQSRYGDITNVQQANASLPPLGYAAGGLVAPLRVQKFDTGRGTLRPGYTLAYNGTGRDEHLSTGGGQTSLDDWTVSRLAQALQSRPVRVEIDERNWSVSVSGVAM